MSGSPRVSVITANYNGAAYLEAAVRAVLDQTLEDLELIIVDDRSSDDSVAVIARAVAGDPRVRVLVQDVNSGPGAARNRGFDAACGTWLAVFDSDDLMTPDRLQRLVARGEADRADIVVDNLAVFTEGVGDVEPFLKGRAYAAARWIDRADYIAAARLYARGPGLGYLKPLFRADALSGERYRADLKVGEDYDLVVRLLAQGRTMRLEPEALYRYRKHGASISHVLRREHLLQMITADVALDGIMMSQPRAARKAQAARRRSLHAALTYDEVVTLLKAGDVVGGLRTAVAAPEIWPLLRLPVLARVRRVGSWFGHGFGGGWREVQ